ncbi:uncharacterized protein LOC114428641 [Parambassis ranga]|uniref:Uncharacterized protein LOC114428641 n=1 Tax=Parambassis ranga TaxID=210632 RepID=A0A6P7HM52_9TELE|nr:uncharacterized protein LOC114428641 [Parambassis ranga]XP_028253042.1 uncharacterized protein LOC114428641 [Parambassis ranga]XP_028253051.1 uncharacterized protein LOC114428641 [Parambassis ranga]
MTQTNLLTGSQRNVRRCPKFTSNTAGLPSSLPLLASSSQPAAGPGCKREIKGDNRGRAEYQAQICSLDSAAIERLYQQNPQGQLHFTVKRYSNKVDFSRKSQINNIGTKKPVRWTVNAGVQHSSSSASPQWQFKDMDGIWKDYTNEHNQSNISSQDIDLQYQQNPSGTMVFTTKNFSYELNFSAMTQRNLSTNTINLTNEKTSKRHCLPPMLIQHCLLCY